MISLAHLVEPLEAGVPLTLPPTEVVDGEELEASTADP